MAFKLIKEQILGVVKIYWKAMVFFNIKKIEYFIIYNLIYTINGKIGKYQTTTKTDLRTKGTDIVRIKSAKSYGRR